VPTLQREFRSYFFNLLPNTNLKCCFSFQGGNLLKAVLVRSNREYLLFVPLGQSMNYGLPHRVSLLFAYVINVSWARKY
jgi:hypothetical protein